MKLVWFPAWLCQNYTFGESFGSKCPYCPYSLNKQTNRLIYNNQETSSDERAEASDLIGFFCGNYEAMGRHLEVSGGEALMRKDVAFILAAIPHGWAMSSNTLHEPAIDAIVIDDLAHQRAVDVVAQDVSASDDSHFVPITVVHFRPQLFGGFEAALRKAGGPAISRNML